MQSLPPSTWLTCHMGEGFTSTTTTIRHPVGHALTRHHSVVLKTPAQHLQEQRLRQVTLPSDPLCRHTVAPAQNLSLALSQLQASRLIPALHRLKSLCCHIQMTCLVIAATYLLQPCHHANAADLDFTQHQVRRRKKRLSYAVPSAHHVYRISRSNANTERG